MSCLIGLSPVSSTNGAEDAARLYEKLCSQCHGRQGNGQGRGADSLLPKPTDFTSAKVGERLGREQIILAIRDGKAGTAMVGYSRRLNEQQIAELTDYVQREFIRRKSHAVTSASGDENGWSIYVEHCAACHGDKGETAVWAKNGLNPPPRNFTTPQAREELSLERMIASVTHGRPGTAMMSFQGRLSEDQIQAVVDYIRTNFMHIDQAKVVQGATADTQLQSATTQVPLGHPKIVAGQHPLQQANVDMEQVMPRNLNGNVATGGEFYMSNCFTCHGKKGFGDGPRAHFNRPRPRNFTTRESRSVLNRPRIFRSIQDGRRGTVMPAWGRVLNEQQIADVAEFVFQAFVLDDSKVLSNALEKKSPNRPSP